MARVWVVVCLLAGIARADHKQEAARLFDEGRALVEKARFDEACERFSQSNDLEPAAGTEANLGDCQEHLGHLADAWRWFVDAAKRWDIAGDARASYARKRAGNLEQRLGVIALRLADADGVTVTIAGRRVEARAKIKERVDPGVVAVRVEGPNVHVDRSESVEAGEEKVVPVIDEPARPVAPVAPVAPSPSSRRGAWKVAFWSSVVIAGAGAGLWLYGHSQVDDARDRLCQGGAYTTPNCANPATLSRGQIVSLDSQGDRGSILATTGSLAVAFGGGAAALAFAIAW